MTSLKKPSPLDFKTQYARANDPWKRRLRPTPQQAVAA